MAYDSARVSNNLRDLLVAKFAWPVFEDAELRLFCDAVAEAIENELPNIELKLAALVNKDVTVTGGSGLTAEVDDGTVEGGVE